MTHGPGPRELTLYVTGACDAHCAFCKRESEEGVHREGTMRPALVAEILDRFPTVEGCCIAGFGEPLLVPWLGEIVDLLAGRGVHVGVITNGSRLLARADEPWLSRLSHVSVSLNAATAEEHSAVFGTSTWDQVLEGIRVALGRGVRVGASFVVPRRLAARVPSYLALAADLGLRFAHLHALLPHEGPLSPSFLLGALREGSPEASYLDAVRLRWEQQGLCPGMEVGWPAPLPRSGNPLGCHSPFVSIGVDAAGNVTACRRVQEPRPAHGKFRDEGVWENEHFTRYRRELSGQEPASSTCLACFGSVKG